MNNAFTLIDEQEHFIVINKACDINFHDEGERSQGVFNQVKNSLTQSELYPVHRLDKMTSGLLILAKSLTAAQHFQQLFEQHQVEKYYLALSANKPKKKQGVIKGDMVKSRRGMWKLQHSTNNPAVTQFFSFALGQKQRLFLLKPQTGKTHQLRVAMASLGAAITGDPLYSKMPADRGYLHAYALKFILFDKPYCYTLPPQQGELFTQMSLPEEVLLPFEMIWPKLK